jgi:hypothetical protein
LVPLRNFQGRRKNKNTFLLNAISGLVLIVYELTAGRGSDGRGGERSGREGRFGGRNEYHRHPTL